MRRTIVTLAALSFLAVPSAATAGGGCHNTGPAEEVRTTTVLVDHACFGPFVARVPLGAKVTWRNESGLPHNITGPAIDFQELPIGGTYERRFNEQGIYVYACMLHPGMSGAVIVRDEGAPGAHDGDANAAAQAVPVASETGTGTGGTPWLLGGLAVLAAGAVAFVTRTSRTRGVPEPAR